MGSMERVERSTRGVEEETRVGTQAWSKVAGRRFEDMDMEGSSERQG